MIRTQNRTLARMAMKLLLVGLCAAATFTALSIWSRFRRAVGGCVAGTLADCPASPNCVCSQATRAAQRIEPFVVPSDQEVSLEPLRRLLAGMPGASIVVAEPHYLHVEFRSRLFRFVDDVEFLIDVDQRCIHVRSASRVGYSDLNANRNRIEAIRAAYQGRE